MLVGAHVSTAGGLVEAHARGVEVGADAIQVFNQSPRMWKPTRWRDDDIAAFREAMAAGPIRSVVIHAVYLINCASKDPEIRAKSLASLTHSLRMGDAIGAEGVVLHPGSTVGEPHEEALERVGELVREALAGSGGDDRIGLCLDSCHLLASGFDVRTPEGLERTIVDCVAIVGERRLRCLHVNDSKSPLGSNRDRHAPLGDGELGSAGCAAFLSEPRFEGLPAIFEGPGIEGKAPSAADVRRARELRAEGLRARGLV